MTIPLKPINTNGYSDFVIFDRTKHYGRVNFDYYFLFYLTIKWKRKDICKWKKEKN